MFASVLGNGRAELWDVCRSVLEPVAVYLKEGTAHVCIALHWPPRSSCFCLLSTWWREQLCKLHAPHAGAALTCAAFSGSKRSPVLAISSDDGSVALLALTGLPKPCNSAEEVYAALGLTRVAPHR